MAHCPLAPMSQKSSHSVTVIRFRIETWCALRSTRQYNRTRALKWKLKDARREICRWQDILQHVESIFEKEPRYKPTPANPLVFHLHGALDVSESLVLTEDDYLTFLANIAAKPDLLPDVVQQAFAATSFLFIGYRLGDWNFRVLFQTLRAR